MIDGKELIGVTMLAEGDRLRLRLRDQNGQTVLVTLRTPEGQAVCFAMKPWHIQGMATIATHGRSDMTSGTTIH